MKNSLAKIVITATRGLLDLIVPRLCAVCGTTLIEGEDVMCLGCRATLPVTNIHLKQSNDIQYRLISLKAPLCRCTSYFYYHKENQYAKLIHDAKYHGRPRIGRVLAREHSAKLLADGFFDGIDAIAPIPLHFIKHLRRTYNQSEEIARGISDVTGLPIIDNLKAARYHATQTRKSAAERKINASGSFKVTRKEEIEGLHLLIVDDVITTGATMLEAMETLKTTVPTVTLSVFSLALTSNS